MLFKSVSLQQDDKRSKFQPEPGDVTLDQAAILVMNEPNLLACGEPVAAVAGSQPPAPCGEKIKRTDFKP